MKFIRLILIISTIVYSVNINAVTIMGDMTCFQWVEHHADEKDNASGIADTAWLMGLFSGLVIATKNDVLKNTDGEFIHSWIDDYCKNNPSGDVSTGARILFQQLRKKKH